mmetsp:Transcript_21175/g.31440  ORF Transcript_21175/g.31440 Transcript_21175/m.31440 type:complete len:213 (+) Transcript_21175:1314-1952(+)
MTGRLVSLHLSHSLPWGLSMRIELQSWHLQEGDLPHLKAGPHALLTTAVLRHGSTVRPRRTERSITCCIPRNSMGRNLRGASCRQQHHHLSDQLTCSKGGIATRGVGELTRGKVTRDKCESRVSDRITEPRTHSTITSSIKATVLLEHGAIQDHNSGWLIRIKGMRITEACIETQVISSHHENLTRSTPMGKVTRLPEHGPDLTRNSMGPPR